ncbi:hypothetical protein DICPUDRAFT_81813 [Dictyostelium purpureum]|uniref:Nudix hydrolase domain-containing protein n=1 Tax=Dictyostelium purpureum TaxID=5786 RepID=F0ZUN6_DICPU|nr:uncharacterized protein DICPUDRAFT_81813 [Dictyostelium purpureum]EGC32340.1 hypothetical protein DICPUDRAFT_81813 [Dictyostelium purpureum]|eukprot:XP_003291142.1 hypothetical protein DICPUDRAFT_81813 [Dictyostelium purpureum]
MSHLKGSIKKIDVALKLKWIQLDNITYIDSKGRERLWESASRTTKKGDTDGVDIIATVKKPDGKKYVVLILQYRPPVNNLVLEFPAGLVDGDEDVEKAAIRELKEETGYVANKVLLTSPSLPLECGMSDANAKICVVDLEETISQGQELEDSEDIEVYYLALDNLYNEIEDLRKKLNCLVAVQLYTFAMGLNFNNILNGNK